LDPARGAAATKTLDQPHACTDTLVTLEALSYAFRHAWEPHTCTVQVPETKMTDTGARREFYLYIFKKNDPFLRITKKFGRIRMP
jgi:hypothetical protein